MKMPRVLRAIELTSAAAIAAGVLYFSGVALAGGRIAPAPHINMGGGGYHPPAMRPNTGGGFHPPAGRPNTGGGFHPPASRPSTGGGYHPPAGRPSTGNNGAGHPNTSNVHPNNGVRPGGTAGGRPSSLSTPRGGSSHTASSGSSMRTHANGSPAEFHDARRGTTVQHGLNGGNRVSSFRSNHEGIVSARGRPGFVQHPYSYGGREFASRTYVSGGRVYSANFMAYSYRGAFMSVYAPGFYYSPYFYGWAYNPWGTPFAYGWGFAGLPWYGYYGYYFSPYATYPSAAYWLTDYLISQDLQTAYTAHVEGGETDGMPPDEPGQAPALTPDVKQMISDEVRNQLALENQEAQMVSHQQDVDPGSSGIDRILNDAAKGKSHVFVVNTALDVVDTAQNECSLSDGDVLSLQTAPPGDATTASLLVLSSKGGQECAPQTTVTVQLTDLQEMQNHMRELIDQGLQELQKKQGSNGIPALPASVPAQPTPAPYSAIAPPPDPNAAVEIQQQADQASEVEKDVSAETATVGGSGQ